MEPIILASSSPRRQELLNMLGIPYQVVMPDIDETIPEGMNAEEAAEHFATKNTRCLKTHATRTNYTMDFIRGYFDNFRWENLW